MVSDAMDLMFDRELKQWSVQLLTKIRANTTCLLKGTNLLTF